MPRRAGNFPLKSGDRVVFCEDDVEGETTVAKASNHKIAEGT